jgi:hypothetical protein
VRNFQQVGKTLQTVMVGEFVSVHSGNHRPPALMPASSGIFRAARPFRDFDAIERRELANAGPFWSA